MIRLIYSGSNCNSARQSDVLTDLPIVEGMASLSLNGHIFVGESFEVTLCYARGSDAINSIDFNSQNITLSFIGNIFKFNIFL